MVQLEEVEDEDLAQPQLGKEFTADDDDDFTDTDSEISEDDLPDSSLPLQESLSDRIYALKDILPPSTRRRITTTVSTASSYLKGGLLLGGKTMWVISTSALLIGVPWLLAFAEEQQMVEMEKEQRMREMSNELLTPGATSGQQQGRPAL
ncbi:MAG: mitochondrial import receptor protein [Icmadophila ericetorum]|nr:mitochondrial import receptor protein [Icmadophila ericetorum]